MPSLRPTIVAIAVLTAAAVVAGSLAPVASGKAISRLTICGPEGCVNRTDEALRGGQDPHVLLNTGMGLSESAVSPEPWLRVRFGMGDGVSDEVLGRWGVDLLPKAGHMRAQDGTWTQLDDEQRARWQALAAGIARFPARRLKLRAAPVAAAVPDEQAASRPESGAAPAGRSGGDGGGPWPALAGIGALLAALAVAAARVVRRRRGVERLGPAV